MAASNVPDFSIYNLSVALLTLAVTWFVARKSALAVVVFLNVHHKMAVSAIVIYFLLIWGVQFVLLTYLPQPRQWVATSVTAIQGAGKYVQGTGPQLVRYIGDGVSNGISGIMNQLAEAMPDPTIAVALPVETPNPGAEAFCESRPGRGFVKIYLRTHPTWDEDGDLNYVADRHTMLKIYSKLICTSSEGDSQVWFEVRATDGSRRFVAEAVCPATIDVQMLPDIDWRTADGTNLCSSYR
jgi:hypothetical protein